MEPERETRLALRAMLRGQSYRVVEASSGARGLIELAARRPRMVLVDWDPSDMTGVELMRLIRQQSDVPAIVISARQDESSEVLALDSGAIHYVTKPVSEATFLARVRAVLRSGGSARTESGALAAGSLRADPTQCRAWVRGTEVTLTRTEFRLLRAFMREAGRVLTHRRLLRQVWGSLHARDIQYLRVYIKQLREKIERDPAHPELLLTFPGVGYRLNSTG